MKKPKPKKHEHQCPYCAAHLVIVLGVDKGKEAVIKRITAPNN